jgi:biopolymer transport protein ExbD
MKSTFLQKSTRRSPLLETLSLKGGKSQKHHLRRELALALPLTSLIDAFSIIVIYLLIGTQNSGLESEVSAKLNLPQASHSQAVEKQTAVLRIEQGSYYLNDRIIEKGQLSEQLSALKKATVQEKTEDKAVQELELMVQADTEMKYADLDPLLKAGSQAGIEKLKFAVVPKP